MHIPKNLGHLVVVCLWNIDTCSIWPSVHMGICSPSTLITSLVTLSRMLLYWRWNWHWHWSCLSLLLIYSWIHKDKMVSDWYGMDTWDLFRYLAWWPSNLLIKYLNVAFGIKYIISSTIFTSMANGSKKPQIFRIYHESCWSKMSCSVVNMNQWEHCIAWGYQSLP